MPAINSGKCLWTAYRLEKKTITRCFPLHYRCHGPHFIVAIWQLQNLFFALCLIPWVVTTFGILATGYLPVLWSYSKIRLLGHIMVLTTFDGVYGEIAQDSEFFLYKLKVVFPQHILRRKTNSIAQ